MNPAGYGEDVTLNIREATIDELHSVNAQIAEFKTPYPLTVFHERLHDREWLGLVAEDGDELLGFKLGYELDKAAANQASQQRIFYSWLGGVLPSARRRGAARLLLHAQETWVNANGYQEIRVKSRNRYRNMLMLLLSEGYQIFDIEPQSLVEDNRIWFRKSF